MIRMSCDHCGKGIDRDESKWFGVDFNEPPAPIIVDGEDTGLTELKQLGLDHEFHFCSTDCLTTWAFDRSFQPTGGPS